MYLTYVFKGHAVFNETAQLAHDVVATLGFGCILVTTSETNVVATLCFRRRFSDLKLTLQQRRDPDVVFLTKF